MLQHALHQTAPKGVGGQRLHLGNDGLRRGAGGVGDGGGQRKEGGRVWVAEGGREGRTGRRGRAAARPGATSRCSTARRLRRVNSAAAYNINSSDRPPQSWGGPAQRAARTQCISAAWEARGRRVRQSSTGAPLEAAARHHRVWFDRSRRRIAATHGATAGTCAAWLPFWTLIPQPAGARIGLRRSMPNRLPFERSKKARWRRNQSVHLHHAVTAL